MPLTLYDKIWNDHLVDQQDDGTALLFVDRHLVHEVTSPQAFEGLRNSNRKVRQPSLTLAVADHNVPTTDRSKGIADAESKIQVDTLEKNCKEFGVQYLGMDDKRQGIVHIIGPEQGFTQPGTVIDTMTVIRHGKVRRAKLYYLRDRTGKSARITEKIRKKIGIEVDVKPEVVTEENLAPVELEPAKKPEAQAELKTESSEEKK